MPTSAKYLTAGKYVLRVVKCFMKVFSDGVMWCVIEMSCEGVLRDGNGGMVNEGDPVFLLVDCRGVDHLRLARALISLDFDFSSMSADDRLNRCEDIFGERNVLRGRRIVSDDFKLYNVKD